MSTRLLIYCMLFVAIITACSKHVPNDNVGRLVYVDDNYVTHVASTCQELTEYKDNKGHTCTTRTPVDTSDFAFGNEERVCNKCVSDSAFMRLHAISVRNIERRRIYDLFVEGDYSMPDIGTFYKDIVTNPVGRRNVYDIAHENGWSVVSYEEFCNSIGVRP